MKKFLLVGVIFFIIGAVAGFGIGRFSQSSQTGSDASSDPSMKYDGEDRSVEEVPPPSSSSSDTSTTSNSLAVADQSAGKNVVVGKVSVATAGWIVIHEDRAGKPGNILGALRVDPGTHSGLTVELLRDTSAGQVYYAMLHSDNGDKKFDHAVDLPVQENGSPVMTKFMATK